MPRSLPIAAAAAPRVWTPVLAGADARRARARIAEIVAAGAAAAPVARSAGLGGNAAWALGLTALGAAPEAAAACLEASIAALTRGALGASFHDGYAGVGLVLAQLDGTSLAADDRAALLTMIDDGVARSARRLGPGSPPELLYGGGGLASYLLARRGDRARRALATIVRALGRTAEVRPDGLAWRAPARGLGDGLRPRFAAGYFETGLAHGAAGVIAILARLVAARVAATEAARLLDGAVAWLRAQVPRDGRPVPGLVGPDGATFPGRAGWCSGDLAVALALIHAGDARSCPAWIDQGLALALAVARRDDDPDVDGAALCHGSAGVALILQRLWVRSGLDALRGAAVRWYRRTLLAAPPPATGGILDGGIGVALALAAAIDERAPAWDRLLLVGGGGPW